MFYDVIRTTYGRQATCQYVDTDSVLCHLQQDMSLRNSNGTVALMPCFFKFMQDHPYYFEFSNFKENNRLKIPVGLPSSNLKCWKDELAGSCITYSIALASKSYAIDYENEETGQSGKKLN